MWNALADINADHEYRNLRCRRHCVILVWVPGPAYRWQGWSTAGHSISGEIAR
jgi:hypothetical protein